VICRSLPLRRTSSRSPGRLWTARPERSTLELPRPSATYLRLAGFPRHRLRHSGGFVGAVILPPITTRCPLPPHSLHSIPAFIPVPWQRSHGTGTFSIVGGLAGMGASGSRIR